MFTYIPVIGLLITDLTANIDEAPWPRSNPTWLQSQRQSCLPGDLAGAMPTYNPGNRPAGCILVCGTGINSMIWLHHHSNMNPQQFCLLGTLQEPNLPMTLIAGLLTGPRSIPTVYRPVFIPACLWSWRQPCPLIHPVPDLLANMPSALPTYDLMPPLKDAGSKPTFGNHQQDHPQILSANNTILWLGWMVKVFTFWSQSVKCKWLENCSSKCTDTNPRLQGSQRIRQPPKETNKAPVIDSKEIEIHKLLHKEFKIIVWKKLNELQENTDRQLNKIRKKTYEQKKVQWRNRNHKKE